MNGDTRRVYLDVRRIGEVGSLAVAGHSGRAVAAHSVGRKEVCVAVSAGCDYDGIGAETLQLAGDEVLGDDTACTAVDDNHVLHLIAGVELHLAGLDLTAQRRVGTEQQLLAGLSLGVERT